MKWNAEIEQRYLEDADKHAEFLVHAVFIPAFKMAFVHGAKHAFAECNKGKRKDRNV